MTDFVAALRLIVVSDLFEGAWQEDSFLMGEAFYLIAETPEGRRFRHHHTFAGEGWNARNDAAEAANRLLARIEFAQAEGKWSGPLQNGHWREIRPCYGSSAYAANWRAYEAASALAGGEYEEGTEREAYLRETAAP